MSKQRIEIDDSLVPAGYAIAGEYRCAMPNEPFLSGTGNARTLHENDKCGLSQPRIILRRVEPVKKSRWVNMYGIGPHEQLLLHGSRDAADASHAAIRLAVLRIDYENRHPVNVALESMEPQ